MASEREARIEAIQKAASQWLMGTIDGEEDCVDAAENIMRDITRLPQPSAAPASAEVALDPLIPGKTIDYVDQYGREWTRADRVQRALAPLVQQHTLDELTRLMEQNLMLRERVALLEGAMDDLLEAVEPIREARQ